MCPMCNGPLQNEETELPPELRRHLGEWRAAKRDERASELRKKNVKELRGLCAIHGLEKNGNKGDLVNRLCEELCKRSSNPA